LGEGVLGRGAVEGDEGFELPGIRGCEGGRGEESQGGGDGGELHVEKMMW